MKKLKLKQVKTFIKKLPKRLAGKAFLTFLGLFALSLIFGIIIFYRYSVAPQTEFIEDGETESKFKLELYQDILEIWKNKEEQFDKTAAKQYLNLFVR